MVYSLNAGVANAADEKPVKIFKNNLYFRFNWSFLHSNTLSSNASYSRMHTTSTLTPLDIRFLAIISHHH